MVRWLRLHCPLDTGFEIRALAVWNQTRYIPVTKAPHNTDFHTWMHGEKTFFVSFKPPRPGTEPRKAVVLTTTLGTPPLKYFNTVILHGFYLRPTKITFTLTLNSTYFHSNPVFNNYDFFNVALFSDILHLFKRKRHLCLRAKTCFNLH